jgi:imidazolonepropionase-like amidohydrolase
MIQLLLAASLFVRAAHLFDGVAERRDVVLEIEGDRIKSVGAAIPAGAKVLDFGPGFTVLPGLIDCHVHLAARADRYDPIWSFRTSPLQQAMVATANARRTLEAGFTTVRDLGSAPFLSADLRDTINEGFLVGPRIVASGPGISITGGHGDLNNYAPEVQLNNFPGERGFRIADGADQVRQTVRAQVKHGVDVIKIHASGGVLSRGDEPGAPQFTLEELKVAVEEAHKAGRRIAAHAHGTRSIHDAVLAGVDSIEHGSLLDDEDIRLMKEHGTFLDADIYNDDYILQEGAKHGMEAEHIEKERRIGRLQRESFARAVKAGVRIAFGTDAGVYPHGDNARQFFYMVKYGLTPLQAIRSATADAAELLNRHDVGQLAAGRFADLIVVPGDALKDVRLLEKVPFVMKGGAVVKDTRAEEKVAAHP